MPTDGVWKVARRKKKKKKKKKEKKKKKKKRNIGDEIHHGGRQLTPVRAPEKGDV